MATKYLVLTSFSKSSVNEKGTLNVNPRRLNVTPGDSISVLAPEWPSHRSRTKCSVELSFSGNSPISVTGSSLSPGELCSIGTINMSSKSQRYDYTISVTINNTVYEDDPSIIVKS